ncbi:hypothetical protein AcW1_005365 [Taiwanofungus camphoratus]|nr:hypothetical protein AcW2_004133 [Antrodia cinnamomea]KAI0933564.1 hypothetical protein AcV5_005681 [Antrodia cinnamomea]KAI0948645.1 hypothetical protein AcV7_009322 [Antrodia cinnamomea]KAI0956758.1 hypothetical protein AcW1_005365 [Antrodia cinnamomea]
MAAFNVNPVMAMAPPDGLAHRPTMRRKSSAQNLLSSFKSTANITSNAQASISSATGLQYAAASTPTASTMGREWDVQSLQSDSVASSAGTASANGNPALAQDTSIEMLRELVRKRIITLTYLRNVHEGRTHWFHTIMITRAELDRVFANSTMKNRTYRFAMLGMGLAHLFDVKDPHDLLRGFSNALNEYDLSKDLSKEENDRPKMRLFRTKLQKRQAGVTDYAISYQDASDAPYLSMPHVPFPLDYHQTLLSLLDVLSEVYNKIAKVLGPSPFPSAGHHMMGPLGLLSPHPGVSYLFHGAEAGTGSTCEGDASLWGIAHAAGPGTPAALGGGGGAAAVYGGALGSPPPSWNSGLADTVRHIDAKLKVGGIVRHAFSVQS